jgi:cobalt-zinc-cadmium efflux system outer membrane protein
MVGMFQLLSIQAQERKIIKAGPEQIEALFLAQNLQLIAERLNVDIADAAVIQARLWNNPVLSLSQVNLWSTDSQREGVDDVIPPLFGSFGKNTEFSVELSQLIRTVGKRRKLVHREKLAKEIALQDFEDVLRGLKVELRKNIHEMIYLQSYLNVLNRQEEVLERLIVSHKAQMSSGNISKNEVLRLQASLLELQSETNETQTEINEMQKMLKILLHAEANVYIEIEDMTGVWLDPENISIVQLLDSTIHRPDVMSYQLQVQYHNRSLAYEKAHRIPDVEIAASYDRYGGVWKNFVGFGVNVELPFFNRNQGNIKTAGIQLEQSRYLAEQQQNMAFQEVMASYNDYVMSYNFYRKIHENEFLVEYETMMDAYVHNLSSKNIGMVEFMDFFDVYKANKQTLLTARKKMNICFEELQYYTGKELRIEN